MPNNEMFDKLIFRKEEVQLRNGTKIFALCDLQEDCNSGFRLVL